MRCYAPLCECSCGVVVVVVAVRMHRWVQLDPGSRAHYDSMAAADRLRYDNELVRAGGGGGSDSASGSGSGSGGGGGGTDVTSGVRKKSPKQAKVVAGGVYSREFSCADVCHVAVPTPVRVACFQGTAWMPFVH
jgi:hypothetical protein